MQKIVVGIDIGGTNTKIGFVVSTGEIIAQTQMSTQKYGADINHFLKNLTDTINAFFIIHTKKILAGIGIGAPNSNYYTGTIDEAPNLPWKGTIQLCQLLSTYFPDIPIKITNDANASALGEMLFGAAKGMHDFVTVTLGTGVGGGIVCNGNIVHGKDGIAGEIGHIIIKPNGRQCSCGRFGCLEAYLSAIGMVKTAAELTAKYRAKSILHEIPFNRMTAKDIYEAALQGDALALDVFEYSGEILGIALSNIIATTSPEAIFITGGVAEAGELLLKPLKKSIAKHILHTFIGKVVLLPSGLPENNAAILGSAALIYRKEILRL